MAFELSSQTQAFASESKQDWKLVNTEEYTSICCYCAGGCWDTSENGAYVWVNKPGTPEFTTPMLTNPKKDMTLQDPMCVYQQFKKHYSRYTLDTVCGICGMDKDVLELVYETYTSTAKPDYEMRDLLWTAICDLYKKEGGANPDPILKTKWDYYVDGKIDPRPVAWALNGYRIAGTDCNVYSTNPKTDLLKGYAELGADGSTACAMWIYSGMWNNNDAPLDPAEQPLCRRNTEDKSGIGLNSEWAFSWPSNRRILYNRNSCDMQGKPWNEDKKLMEWNSEKWILVDQADFVAVKGDKPVSPNSRPSSCCGSRTPAWRATAWSTARCPSISSRSSRRVTTTRSTARSITRAHSVRSMRPRSRAPRSSTRSWPPRTPSPSIGRPAARRVCARRWLSPCLPSSSR